MLNTLLSVFIFVNIFYLVAVTKKNFSVIDIGWGLGFIVIALSSYFQNPLGLKNAIILLVVTAWGIRLSFYLFRRNIKLPEDHRYTKMRNEWGKSANLQAYFKVFLLQGSLMGVIGLPIIFGMRTLEQELSLINKIGLVIWFAGLSFEAYSDAYLSWFKSKPTNKGKLCMSGPWTICRFPNYLGEITLWYGIYLLCLSSTSWWTLLGPLTINFFIVKVSGIPLTEKRYQDRPEYQAYATRVPRLLPFKVQKVTGL